MRTGLLVLLTLALVAFPAAAGADDLDRLTVEYADEPLGLDVERPRFGWRLERDALQRAYQVQVASSEHALRSGRPDVWDSGRVESRDSAQVAYAGPPLEPATTYHWRVRVWTGDRASSWRTSEWETGLLGEAGWRGARWIGRDAAGPAPLLRRELRLDEPVRSARLYISGLGHYEARINGLRVGDQVLDPGHTDYDDSVLYATHDVTRLLRRGANAVAVELGTGWYDVLTGNVWDWHRAPWKDHPKLRALLVVTHADGSQTTVGSDGSWRTAEGPTRFDSVYAGETYDARAERPGWDRPGFDASGWDAAALVDAPAGELRGQAHEPIRVTETVRPVAVSEPRPGVYVFDMGVQISGWSRLRVRGPAGTEVELFHGERLDEDGLVTIPQYQIFHQLDQGQTDRYVLSGDGEEVWEPRFTYKGFRYVQVTGLPGRPRHDTVVGRRVHNDVRSIGSFESGAPLLDRIRGNVRRALLNNHHHVPTDTPVYEKNGWTGDAQLTATTSAYEFDMPRFHTKWLTDIAESQLGDGEISDIVPTPGWSYEGAPGWDAVHGPTPGWDAAYVLIPWWMYQHQGDRRILERHFAGMRRYFDWLTSYADGHVLDVGLGDWVAPGGDPPEGPVLSSTAHSHLFATTLAQIADVLGDPAAAAAYRARAAEIRAAFDRAFWDEQAGFYRTRGYPGYSDEYRQTSNVLAVAFGLVPEDRVQDVVDRLAADVRARGMHLDTGILGTRYLLPVLSEHGHADVAFAVATQRTYPSWGHWLERGQTALQEHWEDDTRSLNHHMFGSIGHWLYADLAGLAPAEPGWATVRVRPHVPAQLDHARASTETARGRAASSWRRAGGRFELAAEIPPNATGEIHVPLLGRTPGDVSAPRGARFTGASDGFAVYDVGPGRWRFTVR
jgi:alpha-L-rhamnosidase